MAINLVKGENAKLNMELFHVGLGWDVNEGASQYDFDLDVSAFMLGSGKKLISDDYLVFYNSECRIRPSKPQELIRCNSVTGSPFNGNKEMRQQSRPANPEISVIGSIDDENGQTSEDGDDETLMVDLTKVSPKVNEIVFTVTIHEWDKRKQNFGQVRNSYIRIYNAISNEEIAKYELDEDFSIETAVEFGRLYRKNGEWKFEAMGIGYKGGLQYFVDKYVG